MSDQPVQGMQWQQYWPGECRPGARQVEAAGPQHDTPSVEAEDSPQADESRASGED